MDYTTILPVCRVCLKTSLEYIDLESPFSTNREDCKANLSYLDAFNLCTNLNVSLEDNYTKNVCHECSYQLQLAFAFIQKAKESDNLLKVKKEGVHLIDDDVETCTTEEIDEDNVYEESITDIIEEESLTIEELNDDSVSVEEDIDVETAITNVELPTISCHICDKKLFSEKSLNSHIARVHNAQREVKDNQKLFLCSICPKTFVSKACLKKHILTHDPARERLFKCDICSKSVFSKEILKSHMRTHSEREVFQCEMCEKTFIRKLNLVLHYQMHKGETTDCVECGKKFVRKRDLEIHMRFHTGENPYECQHCGKRFAIIGHLNTHVKRHQGQVYSCEVCSRTFLSPSSLRNHQYEHSEMPFPCPQPECAKGFPSKSKLKRHIKSVHGVLDEDLLNNALDINTKLNKRGID